MGPERKTIEDTAKGNTLPEGALESNIESWGDYKDRYNDLVQKTRTAVFTDDVSGRFISFNDIFVEMFGYSREDLWSMKFQSLIHPDDVEAGNLEHQRRIASDQSFSPYQVRACRKDGGIMNLEINATRIVRDGRLAGFRSYLKDVTEYRHLVDTARRSEQYYRGLFESAHDAIILFDPDDELVLDVNRRACEIYGLDRDEFVGMSLKDLSDNVERGEEHIASTPEKGFFHHFETEQYRRDGSKMFLEINSSVVEHHGRPVILSINRDITVRKRMEQEVLKSQKLESLGVLAGGIAHDFNNILSGVLGNISLATPEVDPSSEVYQLLKEAENAAVRAAGLTRRLLTFSKGGAPIKEITSIEETLRESAGFAVTGTSARCEFKIDPELWAVECDPGQVGQVIQNLAINAHQAMPDGGVVRIEAVNATVTAQDALPLKPGHYVRVSVRDRGVGVPAEIAARVFDPFFTTKSKGSGLGLAVSHSIVEQHGGYIGATSKVGEGTNFSFYLPAMVGDDSPDTGPEDETSTETAPQLTGFRVLIADDDRIVRELACKILSRYGATADVVRDGAEAVASYRESLAADNAYDAVILDLTIPGGMGGRRAVRHILDMDPRARVVVCSGFANDATVSDYRTYGFSGAIVKPYKPAELVSTLARVLSNNDGPEGIS